ncbi:MAG: phosphatase PAP2 family protein [Bacteriovoracia bacterium]
MNAKLPTKAQVYQYLWTATLLTAFFSAVYGYTNWRADQVQRHFRFYYDWELSIPLIPWMILPYVSLNLLTIAPLFYFSPAELRRLGRTMAVAIVMAGAIFYMFPAPIGFLRPDSVPGIWDYLFKLVWTFDRTNNTLPSLHITFSGIAILALWSKVTWKEKIVYSLWTILICLAVLFTWQHHVWDIVTGLILSVICHKVVSKVPEGEGFSWEV